MKKVFVLGISEIDTDEFKSKKKEIKLGIYDIQVLQFLEAKHKLKNGVSEEYLGKESYIDDFILESLNERGLIRLITFKQPKDIIIKYWKITPHGRVLIRKELRLIWKSVII